MRGMEIATFAGGCFWCTEAIFQRLKGVKAVTPGYTGGINENPTYTKVCSGETGHAEAIQIEFDPKIISFQQLLNVFWATHNPTSLNRQGADIGIQYRSAIFYHSPKQRREAEQSKERLEKSKIWPDPIVTEIIQNSEFYPAEEDHQDFYNKNRFSPYCQLVIDPKIQKLYRDFKKDLLNFFEQ